MYFSRSVIVAAVLGLASATTHSTTASSIAASEAAASATASSTAGMVNTHIVQVGGANGSLVFSPSNVIAEPGDLVQFQFNAKNHSLVQSTFDNPCVPIQNIMPNKTDAFFSGFMPTNRTITQTKNVLTYTVRVTNKTPMWYYCSQAKHCQAGMVGAINAATSGNKTVSAFKALAAQAAENITPGNSGSANNGGGNNNNNGGAASSSASDNSGGAAATATDSSGGAGASASATTSGPLQATGAAARAAGRGALGLGMGAIAAFFVL